MAYLMYINDNCIGTTDDFKYESYPKIIEFENIVGFAQKAAIMSVKTLECKLFPGDFIIDNLDNLFGINLNIRIVSLSEVMRYSFQGFINKCEIKHNFSTTHIDLSFLLSTDFIIESEILDIAETIVSEIPLTPIGNKKLEIEKQLSKQKGNKDKKRTIIL